MLNINSSRPSIVGRLNRLSQSSLLSDQSGLARWNWRLP